MNSFQDFSVPNCLWITSKAYSNLFVLMILFLISYYILFISVCMWVHACHSTCIEVRNKLVELISSPYMWGLGIKPSVSCLTASSFTCWVILPAPLTFENSCFSLLIHDLFFSFKVCYYQYLFRWSDFSQLVLRKFLQQRNGEWLVWEQREAKTNCSLEKSCIKSVLGMKGGEYYDS